MNRFLLFELILLIAGSCTFTTEDDFFQTIPQPAPIGTISLDTLDEKDTIFLYRGVEFSFNVGINKGSIKETKVTLDDRELFSTNSASGKFFIMHGNLKTGTFY